MGDGHITARDPERTDNLWLLGYGVPFGEATVADLVEVNAAGEVVDGVHDINPTAYFIHAPIHVARPELVSAAHTHTHWGTPWSARNRLLEPISQEACAFFEDHALFDDEEVAVGSTDGGKRIAAALGDNKAIILRNHGLLTVGASVGETVGWFVMMERVAEVSAKIADAIPISPDAARIAHHAVGRPESGWQIFRWLVATHLSEVDHAAAAT